MTPLCFGVGRASHTGRFPPVHQPRLHELGDNAPAIVVAPLYYRSRLRSSATVAHPSPVRFAPPGLTRQTEQHEVAIPREGNEGNDHVQTPR